MSQLVAGARDMGATDWPTLPVLPREWLRARIARGPLSARELLVVLRDVAAALDHARVHGDTRRATLDDVLLVGGSAVLPASPATGSHARALARDPSTRPYDDAARAGGTGDDEAVRAWGAIVLELLAERVAEDDRASQLPTAATRDSASHASAGAELTAALRELATRSASIDRSLAPPSKIDVAAVIDGLGVRQPRTLATARPEPARAVSTMRRALWLRIALAALGLAVVAGALTAR